MSRRAKWVTALALGVTMTFVALCGTSGWLEGEPARAHQFFERAQPGPMVIAHRGGAGLWPENTLYAFERARELGVDVIELDVRSTSDGVAVVVHDTTVDRTTDGTGRVSSLSLAELQRLDAGYRWSPDGGATFPFRGRGIRVPTLEEVFAALPGMRFNVEPKQDDPALTASLCRVVRERGMGAKVLVGSFSATALERFRGACPEVATSASPAEVSKFLAMQRAGIDNLHSPRVQALQVPEYAGALRILTESFVASAHARNLEVHAWTVNRTEDMRRLLDAGVDGLMTDYPDRLLALLGRTPQGAREGR